MSMIQEQEERDFTPASIGDISRYQHATLGYCDYDCHRCQSDGYEEYYCMPEPERFFSDGIPFPDEPKFI